MGRPHVPAEAIKGQFLDSSTTLMETCEQNTAALTIMAYELFDTIHRGGTILLCGNGGSSAQADHMAAELLVRLRPDVDRPPLRAMSLNMDMASMTACGNDYSYRSYFSRMVNAHGKKGDALVVFSTSGKSPNISLALQTAEKLGVRRFGMFGRGPNACGTHCQGAIFVPSDITARIQEAHLVISHVICLIVEDLYMSTR